MEQKENSNLNPNRVCYVCGFNFDLEPESDRQEWPFIFCPCCCFEYGIDDKEKEALMTWRENWIRNGLQFGYRIHPDNYQWDWNTLIQQLNNLKQVTLDNYPQYNYDFIKRINPNYTTEVDLELIKRNWLKYR